MLVTAESCTGGGIALAITDIPGSSSYFAGGIVTYSNEMKQNLLGVPPEMLETYGAVSDPVAKAMAEGALKACNADIAVSATGIAGPGRGSDKKPVGLVYTGYALKGRPALCIKHNFSGSREEVRQKTIEAALENLIRISNDID